MRMPRLSKNVRQAFAEFGRIGGKRGGSKGGKTRAANLSPEERHAIAVRAARARWAKRARS
jgi:hypothetical protein